MKDEREQTSSTLSMKILFIHQNFPAQFMHLAPALVQQNNNVMALVPKGKRPDKWKGIPILAYPVDRRSTKNIHPWLIDFETKIIRAEAVLNACLKLREQGYSPDIIIAHHGWGESLFLKDVWPHAKLAIYCEFFYQAHGYDVGFDPEFQRQKGNIEHEYARLRLKNLNNLMHFEFADAGLSPTYWQASSFPEQFRDRISVIHDGIFTEKIRPNDQAKFLVQKSDGSKLTLTHDDEVITFVNRNLEPYRGFHIFMRSLQALLGERPDAQVLIVGGEDSGYGARPDPKTGCKSWKEVMLKEQKDKLSREQWSRIHFLGRIPYQDYLSMLQISSVHVYLTYPFVLSWSLLESMSAGCAIVASDTPPLHEAISHGETGRLFDFFDANRLTDEICALLENSKERARLGANAREFAVNNYDLQTVCLPKQLQWIQELASTG